MQPVIFTVAMDGKASAQYALGLGRSLRLIGDLTRRVVVTDQPDHPWLPAFDHVLLVDRAENWEDKLGVDLVQNQTSGEHFLYVDPGTLAFKRLDAVFAACEGLGWAVQERAAPHLGTKKLSFSEPAMLYFDRSEMADSLLEKLGVAKDQDPAHTIPLNDDFYRSTEGLTGELELDVEENKCGFITTKPEVRRVNPTLLYAANLPTPALYHRELAKLAKLEEYEKKHGFGHISAGHKLRRSLERRILRLMKKG